ncbi:hypothetical protein JN01_0012 [Entomoplasma freundtii]|uniref:Uncharacterized protein n=1 Tax=Entomoplasma freundtii TaxID=74700 RepID=A0A2K8NTW2_9MOLU|nr:hypothetical protein [Entomoplasma freundtii]ATZ16063.1 hypothetical protein EFREU_v1c00360 [Entomoplasma freundtii]TDY58068.1 hypothetical protein JN01_0012 [Entomoplasma freundtii]
MTNNFDNRGDSNLLNGTFPVENLDEIVFKTIVTREGDEHDLLEFWVNHDGKKVHCIAWDATANALKQAFDNHKPESITLLYKHKQNRFTQDVDYSVRRFELN